VIRYVVTLPSTVNTAQRFREFKERLAAEMSQPGWRDVFISEGCTITDLRHQAREASRVPAIVRRARALHR
jgi:hypothetical protein